MAQTVGPVNRATERRRHPVRGVIAGFLLGLGVLVLLIVYGKSPFTDGVPYLIVLALFMTAGLLVGLFAPARRR